MKKQKDEFEYIAQALSMQRFALGRGLILPILLGLLSQDIAYGQQTSTFLRCADVSFLNELEAAGAVYRDGTALDDPLRILQRRGLNTVRLRLWHTPFSGQDGLEDVLAAAQRAQALGLGIVLDFHFSDTWADPAHQTKPAAWAGLSYPVLEDSLHAYTRSVLTALATQGTIPAIVQIGNEVTGGMLWNEGRVGGTFDTPTQWTQFAGLLRAAIAGIREVVDERSDIMIHIDRGGDRDGAVWFFDHLVAEDVAFDLIGLSYYPWWHGTLDDLQNTLHTLAMRYARPLLLIETAYPWTLAWFDNEHNLVGLPDQLLPGYPATPAGQLAFVAAVTAQLQSVPENLGQGVCYWAPDYVAAPRLGSSWENLALFDQNGDVLPAATALGGSSPTHRTSPKDAIPTFSVYPNPATDQLHLRYHAPNARCTRVVLHDVLGRAVLEVDGGCTIGPTEVDVPLKQLASGIYRYVIYHKGGQPIAQGTILVTH